MAGRHRHERNGQDDERVLTPTVLAVFVFGIALGMLFAVGLVRLQTYAWPWEIPAQRPLTINDAPR